MTQKTLLILGAGKEQVVALTTAARKGIRTIALDMNAKADGATVADEFYAVSTRDIGAILTLLRDYPRKIDGVMTIASDIPHCVSAAAAFLKVPHIPLAVAETCINKFRMKEALARSGVNIPRYAKIAGVAALKDFIAAVGYPVVIKPVDNSGARGVLRVTET